MKRHSIDQRIGSTSRAREADEAWRAAVVMRAGQVVVFTCGEYSDRYIAAKVRALRDVTGEELRGIERDAADHLNDIGSGFTDGDLARAAIARMIRDGIVEDAGAAEIHLGDVRDSGWRKPMNGPAERR